MRYLKTIENFPSIDVFHAEMLRKVFETFERLPKDYADTACLYFGLMDGYPRSYSWLRENTGKYYDENLDYTYNISPYPYLAIDEAKDRIAYRDYTFSEYRDFIRRLL